MTTAGPSSVLLAVAGILASVSSSSLTISPHFVLDQRRRAEWAAWGLLALSCRLSLRRRAGNGDGDTDKEAQAESQPRALSERKTWCLALLLVVAQLLVLKIGRPASQWVYPLIPLLTLLIKTYWRHRSIGEASSWHTRLIQQFENLPIATAFVGLSCVTPLGLLYRGVVDSASSTVIGSNIFLAAILAYGLVQLEAISDNDANGYEALGRTNHLDLFSSVATKAFVLCTLYLAISSAGLPSLHILTFAFTCLRMLEVYATVSLCFSQASISASTLLASSAAITSTLNAIDTWSSYKFLLTAGAAVFLTRNALPHANRTHWIYVLLLLPVTSWLLVVVPLSALGRVTGPTIGPTHPIQRLVDSHNEIFVTAFESQSKTLEEAVTEYQRRYRRSPPPGFDRWFEVAQEKEFQLIDEFDTVMETLEPYWGLSPAELRERVDSAEKAENMIAFTKIREGVAHESPHPYATIIWTWLEFNNLTDVIPELKFLISAFDEPRVVAPYDALEQAMEISEQSRRTSAPTITSQTPAAANNDVHWINIGKQGTFEAMVSSCHIDSPARSGLLPADQATGEILPFVNNITAAMDVCASDDLLHHHGVLSSPDTMILTHSLVPIFSQCKPSVFSDVLYPSPYYSIDMGDDKPQPADVDPPWEDKLDRVYWAGASTGGYSTAGNWFEMHRQRLTIMTEPGSTAPVTLLERNGTDGGLWRPRQSTYAELEGLFYLRITGLAQYDAAARQAMEERFGAGLHKEDRAAPFKSKYALDIDGNAYSGRFYRLLKSNSAVLKHTSFKEWHDGRLEPWVHYIPVSPGAEELGETMRFLTQEEEGREIGRAIAEQGRDWARRTLRDVDLQLVMIRLLMEYGRVMSDDRDTLAFELEG